MGFTGRKWVEWMRGSFSPLVINNSMLAHRHTQPWFRDKQTTCRRLVWNHGTHDTYSKDDNQQFPSNEVRYMK